MTVQPNSSSRLTWSRPYMRWARAARVVVLGVGLSVGLVFAAFGLPDLGDESFLWGLGLFVVATGLTWTPGFTRVVPWALTLIALLDLGTITLFDLIPRAEVMDALVAFPAMCLGLTLGRRGVVVAVLAVSAMVITPGVLTTGAPSAGWVHAISISVMAGVAAAGIAVSTEVWSKQVRSIEEQGRELQRAAAAKYDFIALVSHELRTPLTSIMGYLQLLEDVEEPMPQEAQHYLAAVDRNSERLLLLVTDLLAASEVENTSMRLDFAPTDLTTLAQHSLDDLSQRAADAGLSLLRDLPPNMVIDADPSRLMQVVDNLVSNAIKFTPAGGQVFVTLLRSDDGVDLVVRDTGIGIASDSLVHLATKFYRTPQATDAAIPGVGLGLMITKTIVEAHHGSMTFSSREHEGTTVQVHLPRNQPSSSELAPMTTPVAASERPSGDPAPKRTHATP